MQPYKSKLISYKDGYDDVPSCIKSKPTFRGKVTVKPHYRHDHAHPTLVNQGSDPTLAKAPRFLKGFLFRDSNLQPLYL